MSEQEINDISISVEDLITALQTLNPKCRVCITQRGYYSEGDFADIFKPQRHEEWPNLFVIGHSESMP